MDPTKTDVNSGAPEGLAAPTPLEDMMISTLY